MRCHRRVFAAVMTTIAVIAPTQLSASAPLPLRTGIFKIHIEANKNSYTLGEPIYLRLTVTNMTGQVYSFERQPPSWITGLIIRDANGSQCVSDGGVGNRGYMVGYTLQPGSSISPTFELGNAAASEWEDIKWWGCHLTKPGVYTITAVSKMRGYFSTPQGASWFIQSKSDKSNAVTIVIH